MPTIIQKGSRRADLHNLAVNLYYTCRSTGVNLNCKWIPRGENHLADQISKYVDYDAWKATADLFQLLDYANATNTKTRWFNSQYWSPACEAVDAFTQNWADNINWLVPSVYLVSRAIRHAEGCKAAGTLVVPYWQSAPCWPLLFGSNKRWRRGITDVKVFDNPRDILELGEYKQSVIGSDRFTSPILSVKIVF